MPNLRMKNMNAQSTQACQLMPVQKTPRHIRWTPMKRIPGREILGARCIYLSRTMYAKFCRTHNRKALYSGMWLQASPVHAPIYCAFRVLPGGKWCILRMMFTALCFRRVMVALLFAPFLAQADVADKHIAIIGSERFRIVYDSAFTWPGDEGNAKMYLPIPPDTGAQHITSFTSSIKGAVETDDNGHRMIVATLHPGDSRRVHWRVVITGTWRIRQLEDGAPMADDTVSASSGGFLGASAAIK